MRILVLNGPNLNRLGTREPEIYGSSTLADIEAGLRSRFPNVDLRFEQHSGEGQLIDALHAAKDDGTDAVVLNAAGYTHTSVALRDAIVSVELPTVEVHISNVAAREPFRHLSLISAVCVGTITGLGIDGYRLAVDHLVGRG